MDNLHRAFLSFFTVLSFFDYHDVVLDSQADGRMTVTVRGHELGSYLNIGAAMRAALVYIISQEY